MTMSEFDVSTYVVYFRGLQMLRCRILLRRFCSDNLAVPIVIDSKDVETQITSGSGPGGQKVNKSQNCVHLQHLPTNTVVRCHESRQLHVNMRTAWEKLIEQVDYKINGENSRLAIKMRRLEEAERRSAVRKEKRRGLKQLQKQQFHDVYQRYQEEMNRDAPQHSSVETDSHRH